MQKGRSKLHIGTVFQCSPSVLMCNLGRPFCTSPTRTGAIWGVPFAHLWGRGFFASAGMEQARCLGHRACDIHGRVDRISPERAPKASSGRFRCEPVVQISRSETGPMLFSTGPATFMVGLTGFEPAASASRTQRSTKLSHNPKAAAMIAQEWSCVTQRSVGQTGGERCVAKDCSSRSRSRSGTTARR